MQRIAPSRQRPRITAVFRGVKYIMGWRRVLQAWRPYAPERGARSRCRRVSSCRIGPGAAEPGPATRNLSAPARGREGMITSVTWRWCTTDPMLQVGPSPARGHSMNEQRPAASLQRFFSAPLAETDPEVAAAIG